MEKKRYAWAPFLVSVILLFIALITPAAWYINPAGSISLYLWGAVVIIIYGYGTSSGTITNPEVMTPAVFTVSILVISLFTLSILTSRLMKDIKNFKVLNIRYFLLFNALALLISTIIWIVQFTRAFGILPEELIEMGYNNIWDIFSPSFGLIGIFFAVGLILAGIIYIQFNYNKILGVFVLPPAAQRINKLNMTYRDILNEIDQIRNIAKERYIEKQENLNYLDMLNERELRRYNHLNRMADKINSVLFKSESHEI
ncbi:MAG: hypothetical protein ACFFFB_00805 [Candidatus Heimdallarchaeota archaeon]